MLLHAREVARQEHVVVQNASNVMMVEDASNVVVEDA
jgi:hypothetical protein